MFGSTDYFYYLCINAISDNYKIKQMRHPNNHHAESSCIKPKQMGNQKQRMRNKDRVFYLNKNDLRFYNKKRRNFLNNPLFFDKL